MSMDYKELDHFIHKTMKMTHIYQPIMLKTLLTSENYRATVDEIATAFLKRDVAQLKYYKAIVRRWPDQTLRKKHNIVAYAKGMYRLRVNGGLTEEQRHNLIEKCDLRLQEFMDQTPQIRAMRELDRKSISGSVRYDVLARSKGVCVACGTRSTAAALHVDHILPVSMGGETVPSNLQALCYKCNTQKRDRDDTDFILWHKRLQFGKPRKGCGLCKKPKDVIADNPLAYAVENPESGYSVVPNRHVGSFLGMIPAERNLCMNLVDLLIHKAKQDRKGAEFDISGLGDSDHPHCTITLRTR